MKNLCGNKRVKLGAIRLRELYLPSLHVKDSLKDISIMNKPNGFGMAALYNEIQKEQFLFNY